MNFCRPFSADCESPEPFASLTDISVAAQYLEKSIHAPDRNKMENNLAVVLKYLQYARSYLKTAHLTHLVTQINQVISDFNHLLDQGKKISNKHRKSFQENNLYGFMGVLSALERNIQNVRSNYQNNLESYSNNSSGDSSDY